MSRVRRSRLGPLLALGIVLTGCSIVPNDPPVAPGEPFACIDTPQDICQQALRDAQSNADPGTTVVALRVVCTSPPCTDQGGEVAVDVAYSNGRRDSYSNAWAGAMPEPEMPPEVPAVGQLPVEPACGGVPRETCLEFASTAVAGLDPATIVTITLRCTAVCATDRGEGQTTVMFRDGTTTTSDWSYLGGAP